MQINKLSKLSGVNPETIRVYRKRNLLRPKKLDNGYYEYSPADYISLLYIRKLRGYSIGLEDISTLYDTEDPDKILKIIEKEQNYLSEQIARLQEEQRYLELERIHITESFHTGFAGVQVMQSIDEKIDLYEPSFSSEELLSFVQKYAHKMTPTLRVRKEILNGSMEDRRIPVEMGFGTYRYVINEANAAMPKNYLSIPNGIHISQMIRTSDLYSLQLSQLFPMMECARKNNTPFISDTTGYLMHIEQKDGIFYYHFRIRACIEKNEVITARP
jgi:DNA-binding transcriptional MerR regulator